MRMRAVSLAELPAVPDLDKAGRDNDDFDNPGLNKATT